MKISSGGRTQPSDCLPERSANGAQGSTRRRRRISAQRSSSSHSQPRRAEGRGAQSLTPPWVSNRTGSHSQIFFSVRQTFDFQFD
jgi:hypothetical protein